MRKKIIFLTTLIFIILFLGRNLNPFSSTMFEFHDQTQPARIQQFVLNLKNLKIPPRIVPDFSFKMGYPLFSFYAPFSYWVTSIINLLGFDVVNSLKISFLLAIITAFLATFIFLHLFFDFYPSLLGAVAYVTSLYVPVEIFVKGDLAEFWFISLLPLVLFLFFKNAKNKSHKIFFFTTIVLSLIFSAHNLLSLIFIPICLIYIWVLKENIKLNLFAFVFGLILCSYFILPGLLELNFTQALQITRKTNYKLHFLCPYQLWQSPWGYGGSYAGCVNDGMSFRIGKIQLIFALLAIEVLILKRKMTPLNLFFLFLTLVSLFLTTYQSQFIWELFSPIFSLFQFPWRFIAFSLLGISFLISFFWQDFKIKFKPWLIFFFILYLPVHSSSYFSGRSVAKKEFEKEYLSSSYIEKKVVFKVPEYLPKTVNYGYWGGFSQEKYLSLLGFNYQLPAEVPNNNLVIIKNTPWQKEFSINQPSTVILNLHYFPFWQIIVDGKEITPQRFDSLGRPILYNFNSRLTTIKIIYRQTTLEKLGNFLTILSLAILILVVFNKKIWKRFVNYLT